MFRAQISAARTHDDDVFDQLFDADDQPGEDVSGDPRRHRDQSRPGLGLPRAAVTELAGRLDGRCQYDCTANQGQTLPLPYGDVIQDDTENNTRVSMQKIVIFLTDGNDEWFSGERRQQLHGLPDPGSHAAARSDSGLEQRQRMC